MPAKVKVYNAANEPFELYAIDAREAVMRPGSEWTYSPKANVTAKAEDPAPAPAPAPADASKSEKPAPAADDAKARKKALVAEYAELTGKGNGQMLSIDKLEAAIAAAKSSSTGGGGASG